MTRDRAQRTLCLLMLAFVASVPAPVAAGGENGVPNPVKVTDAHASARQEASPTGDLRGRLLQVFEQGGPIMYVLLGLSIIGFAFVLERLFALRRNRHVCPALVEEVRRKLEANDRVAARERLAQSEGATGRILQALLDREGATRGELERVLEDETGRVLWDLRRNVRPAGVVSAVSPLLGLLGTVLGMITAFKATAEKGLDDPAHFAEGIYEALYTTAFGLSVAIPFLLLYHYLRGRADVIMREVEDLLLGFIIRTTNGRTHE
jgi:biopolymer transport protein ExbB